MEVGLQAAKAPPLLSSTALTPVDGSRLHGPIPSSTAGYGWQRCGYPMPCTASQLLLAHDNRRGLSEC